MNTLKYYQSIKKFYSSDKERGIIYHHWDFFINVSDLKRNHNNLLFIFLFYCKATSKQSQQLPTLLVNNVGSCCVHLQVAKILAGFKLCATTLVGLNCQNS